MDTAGSSSLPTSSIAQSLPSYIIYEILKHFSASLVLHQIAKYPWYLAHVCSSWRIEFLTMRRNFWSEFRVRVVNPGMEKTSQRIIDVLTMFLECNRGHPFSFEMEVEPGASRCPYSFPIFNLLISESPRWRRATLHIGTSDIQGLYRTRGQLEHLESLYFICQDSNPDPKTFTDLFMSAPRLTRLSLNFLPTWNFNWSILTFMFLGHQQKNVARLPYILSQAVRLEMLILSLDNESLPSATPIVLPSLLSLDTDRHSLIHAITTPSLKGLHLNNHRSLPELVGTLKSFFGRSQCHLQTLKLKNLDAALVIDILSLTPDIRTLDLCYVVRDSMADVFGWLNGMDRVKTPKLTCLQSLGVHHCDLPDRDQLYKILDFVAQRKTRVGSVVEKLQKLTIKWCPRDREAYGALDEQLRKMCKLYDIQYSNEWNRPYIISTDVHRSQDFINKRAGMMYS